MQKLMRITLLLGFSIVAIFAQNCANPLLNRTDVQARFGGSANILNTSRIAGNLSICPFLSGQIVCVSDDGFRSLQTFLDEYKRSFSERSRRADQHQYSGIGEAMKRTDMNDKKMKSLYTLGMLFNHTILSFNASGATQPYNFTTFYNMVQQMGLTHNKSNEQHETQEAQSRSRGLGALGVMNKTHNESEHMWNFSEPHEILNTTGPHNESEHMWNLTEPWNLPKKIGNNSGVRSNQSHAETNASNRTKSIHDERKHSWSLLEPNDSRLNSSHNESEHKWSLIDDNYNKSNATKGKSSMPKKSSNQTGNGNLRRLHTSNDTEEDSTSHIRRNWMDLQKNLMQAKAKCAISVMKHLYFASCMAAAANTSALNQSTSSNSSHKISPDACSSFKSKCMDYFTYSAAAERTRTMMMNANSTFASELYKIVTSENDTATIYDELNTLAITVLAQMNASGSNMKYHKSPTNLVCNNTNSNASDCNYICTKVLNATGFDEEAFNSISSTNSSSRRHLESGTSITIDPSGWNPETSIGDGDSAVVVSVSSIPDSFSGSKVFASIMMAIAFLLLSLSA